MSRKSIRKSRESKKVVSKEAKAAQERLAQLRKERRKLK